MDPSSSRERMINPGLPASLSDSLNPPRKPLHSSVRLFISTPSPSVLYGRREHMSTPAHTHIHTHPFTYAGLSALTLNRTVNEL